MMPGVSVAALRTRLTPAAPVPSTDSVDAATARARARGRLLVLACLGLAALSLLGPSNPTYDPWAWIIWGREITHLDLNTVSGPSWKPLPVLFTTVFSLFGDDAAPNLWLVIARAGGLLAIAMAYRLGARLGGWPAGVIAALALLLADGLRAHVLARQLRGHPRRRLPAGGRAPPRRPPRRRLPARLRRRAAAAGGVAVLRPLRAVARVGRAAPRACSCSAPSPPTACCGSRPSTGARATGCAPPTARTSRTRTRPRSPTVPFLEVFRRSSAILAAAGADRRAHRARPAAARAALGRAAVAVRRRRPPDDRGGADDRGRLRRQPALRRAAGRARLRARRRRLGRARARGGRALRARRRGRRWPSRSWRPRRAVRVADLDEIARRRASATRTEADALRHAAGGDREGRRASTRSRRCKVYTGPFQVQAVAWYLKPHSGEIGIDPQPPGILIAPRDSPVGARRALPAAHHDPPLGRAARLRRLSAPLSCAPMATYVSRPAWEPRVRSLATARIARARRPRPPRRAQPRRCKHAELNVGYWVDEGLSVGIADRPLTDIPGHPAPGRLAAALLLLLHVWMSLDRQRREGDAHAVAAVRAGRRPGRVLGRGPRVRPPRGVVRGGADRAQPVPLAVRAGDAHVLARRAAEPARDVARTCAPTPSTSARARRWPVLFGARARGRALHPQLGALPRRGDVRRVARAALPGAAAPSAGGGCATARSASGSPRCCTCRGCRRCCSRPRTPARRGRASPSYEDLTMEATHRLLGHTAWLVLVVAAGGGVVALVRAGRGRQLTARGPRRRWRSASWRSGRCCSPTAPRSSRRRGRCATSRSRVPPFLLLVARRPRRRARPRARSAS